MTIEKEKNWEIIRDFWRKHIIIYTILVLIFGFSLGRLI